MYSSIDNEHFEGLNRNQRERLAVKKNWLGLSKISHFYTIITIIDCDGT